MKLSFNDREISQIVGLRDGAAESRRLELEVALVKEKSPGVFKAAIEARARVDRFMPSVLLALGADVLAAREELSRQEFLRVAITSSLAGIETRLVKLKNELKRGMQELIPVLREKIMASFPPPTRENQVITNFGYVTSACVRDLDCLSTVNGGTVIEGVEVLLTLCIEFGAQLPEAVAS